MNILRRIPLSRLLLLCGVVAVVGTTATALALAVGAGPTPPTKPLADAVHDALSAQRVNGVSARIQLTNHLIEGASLASGGGEASQLASSPLLSGASGRMWIGSDGHARLELQSEKGDTQIIYDGHTASLYDASTNTLYRYTPPPETEAGKDRGAGSSSAATTGADNHKIPSVAEIEAEVARAGKHANVSEATPTDVAGQAAYTVRVSPREDGGLIGGAELSWDAVHGVPLRAAVYSTTSAAPVIELAATEISYGPVDSSTLDFTPPPNAKVEDVTLPTKPGSGASGASASDTSKPHVSTHGKGLAAIALVESPVKGGQQQSAGPQLEGLQKVSINGTKASELPTALGTLLSFERAGVRYLLVGSVTPSAIEAFARGL
jgi:outer membrane lipoprotein-sorting protein